MESTNAQQPPLVRGTAGSDCLGRPAEECAAQDMFKFLSACGEVVTVQKVFGRGIA